MSTPAPKSDVQELQARVAALKGGLHLSNILTVGVGMVALTLCAFYASYAYSEIASFAEPENVVMMVDDVLTSNLTSTRKTLQEQIKTSAPEWAVLLSTQAQDSIPQLRKNIEKYALDEVDKQLSQIEEISAEKFRAFVQDHRADFRESVQALANGNEKLSDETMDQLVKLLDAEYGVNLQQTTTLLFKHLVTLNKKLLRLKLNQDLSPEEKLEREIVMQMRALEKREFVKAAQPE